MQKLRAQVSMSLHADDMKKSEISVKHLPNEFFLPHVRKYIDEGHTVTINVRGYSMRPFLENDKDKVTLAPFTELHVADAVLAEIAPGQFVLHRIIAINDNNITLQGDGNVIGVEHCRIQDVCGIVTHYIHPTYVRLASSARLRLEVKLWRRLRPVRRYLLFIYRIYIKIFL